MVHGHLFETMFLEPAAEVGFGRAITLGDEDLFRAIASISRRYASSLLLPTPLGLPSVMPAFFRAARASFVLELISSRSISAVIEKAIAMIFD